MNNFISFEEPMIIKIIAWAQRHEKKIEELTIEDVRIALKTK